MEKVEIPDRVLIPGEPNRFVKQANHPPTKSVGLRYAALWALGARDYLPTASMVFLEEWCHKYHDICQLFPEPIKLESLSFADRLRDCPDAAANVVCYPGNTRGCGTPGYAEVYHLVWLEQKWPELCKALSGA